MTDLPLMIHHKELKEKGWLSICIVEVFHSLNSKPLNHNNKRIIKVENEFCALRVEVAKRSKQYTVVVREEKL